MKPTLSQFSRHMRLSLAITLLTISLLLSLALWAPDHQDGISLWWVLGALASAVQAALMLRAHFAEMNSRGGHR